MDVDGVRVPCPACGRRLVVMPGVAYLACVNCGNEYLVEKRGNSVGLKPFSQEEFDISKEIAAVERAQGEGCSNVFSWIFAVTGVVFCGLGLLFRAIFDNPIPVIIGWSLSLVAVVAAAGVLLQLLNTQRQERLKLEARQRKLAEERDA